MKDPKVIIIAAAGGFFLSFFTALITGARFGAALPRAGVCAVVCAVVAAGVRFAAKRYLAEAVGGAFSGAPAKDGAEGGAVDILLDDEPLPADANEPAFDVGSIAPSLKSAEPLSAGAGTQPAGAPPAAGIPPVAGAQPVAGAGTRAGALSAETVRAAPEKAAASAEPPVFTPAGIGAVARSAAPEAVGSPGRLAQDAGADGSRAAWSADAGMARDGAGARAAGSSAADLPDLGHFLAAGPVKEGNDIKEKSFAAPAERDRTGAGSRPAKRATGIAASDSEALASAIRTLLIRDKD